MENKLLPGACFLHIHYGSVNHTGNLSSNRLGAKVWDFCQTTGVVGRVGIGAVNQPLNWTLNEDPGASGAAAVTAEETCGLADCDPAKDGWLFAYCLRAGFSVSIETATISFNLSYRRHKNELRVIPAPTES